MGESGRKLIQMEFAPQKMADRFVSFYQEMINS
jgi:hypothetical protein